MIIKKTITVLGALVILIGLSQLAFGAWWLGVAQTLVSGWWLALFGVIAIIFGGLMLVAAAEKIVLFRPFFVVIGLLTLGFGALAVLNPNMTRDIADAFVYKRSPGYQHFVILVGGVVRAIIGAVIVYAAVKTPPSQAITEQPPTE